MSLVLNNHLDRLLQYGLNKIRENEVEIKNEWQQIKEHYLDGRKSSQHEIIKAMRIFSDSLFNPDFDKNMVLNHINLNWKEKMSNNNVSQFVLALLESSVHFACKTNTNYTQKDHQAIQYLFTKIKERILSKQLDNPFLSDNFLQHLISSKQLPIEWVAVVIKKDDYYTVERWFDQSKCLYHKNSEVKAETIFELTEVLLKFTSHKHSNDILTVPFEDKYLLICTDKDRTINFTTFMNHALQLLQSGKSSLSIIHQEQQWKDPVLMFNDSIIRARNFNDALETITEGFINYLPFKRCAIFSYSKADETGFGLAGKQFNNEEIKQIAEDITNVPLINNSLEILRLFDTSAKYLQPLYIEDARSEFPQQYVDTFKLKSLVVTPIISISSNELLGAAILDYGENNHFEISTNIYIALTKFGQSSGEALKKFHHSIQDFNKTIHFSPREIEVLKLMAEGESTSSAASILHLSEYTVRDYITSIMQKMNVKNRTEAVARAIRKGVI